MEMVLRTSLFLRGMLAGILTVVLIPTGHAADVQLVSEVKAALRKAGEYYATKVAAHGGYVYYYSPDLSERWGEGKATADQAWVQVPGTPAVGGAFLTAFEATGDTFYLEAARAAGRALLHGQLESGGWTNAVDFDPRGSQVSLYRNGLGNKKGKNFSTLDDGITQGALRFLMRLEKADANGVLGIKESVDVALNTLLAAQFPNGGFPQGWQGPVEKQRAVVKAKYPDYDWRTENRIKNYWEHYTLNDGVCGQLAELLEEAVRLRGDLRCKEALVKLGDFLLLAQMPEPQPAWAQQYDPDMHPIWARKFEPPAIAGRESVDAMLTLIRIAKLTREARFVATIPAARAWMERSLLAGSKLSRYYELKTNKPLYMTADYELTHDDSKLPKHYGWHDESRLEEIDEAMRSLRAGSEPAGGGVPARVAEAEVRKILSALDAEGRWISEYDGEMMVGQPKFKVGQAYLASAVFVEYMEKLSAFLKP
jgi:PelA/Pel-15E family pectate lyase